MPTTDGAPVYVVDCDGLVTIAQTKNNALRSAALQLLEKGKMCVPTGVLSELKNAYEAEHKILASHIAKKIRVKPAHSLKTAALASKANSGFKIEPYGNADWHAAAVAACEDYVLVTTKKRRPFYKEILDCSIIIVDDLAVPD